MNVTWLGQAGLLFDNGSIKIMVDPYLSDSVEKINPKNYRRVAPKESFFDVSPDIMIFTHDHLDHYDPQTVERLLNRAKKPVTVLSPGSVWPKVRAFGGGHNYIAFNRHTQWTQDDFRFVGVRAEHSDPCAIGVIIEDLVENKRYYITGDTLYNTEIFDDIKEDIHLIFLPINGVGNNMNITDAKLFAKRVGALKVIPIHFGMFDEIDPHSFDLENAIIPEIYKKINI